MAQNAAQVYRDFVVDGVPSSGRYRPSKPEIRSLLKGYEAALGAGASGAGSIAKESRDQLYADLSHGEDVMAWVYADPNVAYNGIYRKNGPSGTGSWSLALPLPYSFIIATNVGDGTPNAIEATTEIPISESALIIINITETNTASPVTVSFNGGAALTAKTNSGNDVAIGGLVANMRVLAVASGGELRLVTDQVSTAILAQAELAANEAQDFRDEAAGYATLAMSNWVVDRFVGDGTNAPLVLTVPPGSINNCMIVIEGLGAQPRTIFSLSGVLLSPPTGSVWPLDKGIEVAYGTAIAVNTPSDNSVVRSKIADDAVGPDELDEDAVSAEHIDGSDAADIRTKLGLGSGDTPDFAGLTIGGQPIAGGASFSAHKNGANQTGIAASIATKITFGTEVWDTGSHYDIATGRWTPPAGKYRVNACIYWSAGIQDGVEFSCELWKNGAVYKAVYERGVGANLGISIMASCLVDMNGTDYVEIYGRGGGTGAKTINGTASESYFEGEAI